MGQVQNATVHAVDRRTERQTRNVKTEMWDKIAVDRKTDRKNVETKLQLQSEKEEHRKL
jgi:hypothetical protein